jgi:nitrite reductase/ring-hydroxylating ferredoxin subunit
MGDEWDAPEPGESDVEVLVEKAGASAERAVPFSFVRRGERLGGFVVVTESGPRAYVNRCPHVPYPLDFGDGDVLHEGQIVCVNHGARFDTKTGACLWGPARGRGLERLEVEDAGAQWRVRLG